MEFQPVCLAVVYVQMDGNEIFAIGSRSWFFADTAECLAEAREAFPWKAGENVIPPEPSGPRLWAETLEGLGALNVTHAPVLEEQKRMLATQQLIGRLHVDTAPRPWAPDGNNAELIDSLNGYRVKELGGHADVYTLNVLGSHEQYLSRALEHFAAWERIAGSSSSSWAKPQNYAAQDRGVI